MGGKGAEKGKGKGKGYAPEPTTGGGHYFSAAAGEDDEFSAVEVERKKQEMKWKKKLREVEDLEKKRDGGQTLEPLQLKKLDTKAGILEELAKWDKPAAAPKRKVNMDDDPIEDPIEEDDGLDLDEVAKELAMLEQEAKELEELNKAPVREDKGNKGKDSKGKGKGKDPKAGPSVPSVSLRQQQAQGKALPKSSAPAWGRASPQTQAAQNWPIAKAAPSATQSEGEQRVPLPASSEEQLAQFRGDLQFWSEKFGCSWVIEGREIVAWLTDPSQVDTAMGELQSIIQFDLGGGA